MFGATAMAPQERRRVALEMARLRVARYTSHRHPTRRPPDALPCHDYAKAFADVAVPMGVVEMTDPAELRPWLLVARPVSRKEAEKTGGCIRYTPSSDTVKSSSAAKPRYYCITDTDDEAYGRATYLTRASSVKEMKKSISPSSQDDSSYGNECTEEDDDVDEVSEKCSRRVTPHRQNSRRCVVRA